MACVGIVRGAIDCVAASDCAAVELSPFGAGASTVVAVLESPLASATVVSVEADWVDVALVVLATVVAVLGSGTFSSCFALRACANPYT